MEPDQMTTAALIHEWYVANAGYRLHSRLGNKTYAVADKARRHTAAVELSRRVEIGDAGALEWYNS